MREVSRLVVKFKMGERLVKKKRTYLYYTKEDLKRPPVVT